MSLQTEISFKLHVGVKHDEKARCWASYCPAINVYSAGNTESEAIEAIRAAISTFVRICFSRKILDDVLVNLGFFPSSTQVVIDGDHDDEEEFIRVSLREFGGKAHSINVEMPLGNRARELACQA